MSDTDLTGAFPAVGASCCGGTGTADYAAVPCPNPHCPAHGSDTTEVEPQRPHRLDTDLGAQTLYSGLPAVAVEPAITSDRPWTPPHTGNDGARVVTVKRCCNGCSTEFGDVTAAELDAAIAGRPLPDVRDECPTCAPRSTVTRVGGDGRG